MTRAGKAFSAGARPCQQYITTLTGGRQRPRWEVRSDRVYIQS